MARFPPFRCDGTRSSRVTCRFNPCFSSRSRAISGTYPDPAATSRRDSDDTSISRATRRIIPSVVEIPPNQRLIRRRSPSEAVLSAGVPESVSSSSVVTTRLIGRTSRRSSVTSCQQRHCIHAFADDRRLLLHFCQFLFQQLLVVEIAVVAVS